MQTEIELSIQTIEGVLQAKVPVEFWEEGYNIGDQNINEPMFETDLAKGSYSIEGEHYTLEELYSLFGQHCVEELVDEAVRNRNE